MSADKKPEGDAEKPKKKGKSKMLIMMLGAVGLGGGGVGGALYGMGLISKGGEEAEPVVHHELTPREGATAAQIARATGEAEHGGHVDPRVFQPTYHALTNNFTSNLAGGESFVQIGLGVSTYYGEHIIESVTTHEMAIRSAVLMILSQQDPAQLATPEGKERLRGLLKTAVNNVLTTREGFGGIDEVYFTSFVTQ